MCRFISTSLLLVFLIALFLLHMGKAEANDSWQIVIADTPFNYQHVYSSSLKPLTRADKPWRLCTLYPHLKDSYWFNLNYGMVDQARKLGINLKVLVADGYIDSYSQQQQLQACIRWQADAILLGSVGFDLVTRDVQSISETVPVFGLVNDLNPEGITGKTGVNWFQMGFTVGQWLAKKHPANSPTVTVAWLSSPPGRGGSSITERGFKAGLKNSSVKIAAREYGDNDKPIKRQLIHKILNEVPDIDYLVGDATMAEVAVNTLRQHDVDSPRVISTYLTHGVYRGLLRGKIEVSSDDQPVLQGRMAIDQAIRYLEHRLWLQDFGPQILAHQSGPISPDLLKNSLAPPDYRPVYNVTVPAR
ncbi:TMAO reductase system periplasmic protein TorT [Endozoicomonadaceae bacterium StTr2]